MKNLLMLIGLALAITASLSSSAQSPRPDIFTYQNGNLWQYAIHAGTAMPLTQSGYNGGPILSTDGRSLAFLETSAQFVERYLAGAEGQIAGSPPADIWVMDIASWSLKKIANQSGASSAGYLRSIPAWSPDSRQLAWLQFDPQTQTLEGASLLIYHLDSGASYSLAGDVNLGYQQKDIHMGELRWGIGGIARVFLTYLYGNQEPFLFLEIFNPIDGARAQFNLELKADRSNMVRDFMWANHLGQSVIALRTQDDWQVLNPQDGTRSRLMEPPRLKNRFLSGGLELVPTAREGIGGRWEIHWQAEVKGQRYDTGYISPDASLDHQPALSGDGARMAWHSGERVSIWQLGTLTDPRALKSDAARYKLFPIPDPISLVWAPTEWISTGAVAEVQAAPTSIPNPSTCALEPQLHPGQQAVLSPGLSNRARAAASINAEVIGSIHAGEVVTVTQGPICAGGYYWYEVENTRVSGWTVEGIDGDYWLLYHVDCPNSPPIRLGKGMTAFVSPGQANHIRDGLGTDGTAILGRMPAGSRFVITGYPQCDTNGLRWYPILYNQVPGWTAAGQGSDYWIEPAPSQATG